MAEISSGVGLVVTLLMPRGGHGPVSSFIRWHLHLGFERLYLYFDDDDECHVPVGWNECGDDVRVERIRRSRSLFEEQRRVCKSFARFGKFASSEVQARQVLNAEHAALRARDRGLRWLVHVDIDELFYAESRAVFLSHFATMEREGVEHVTYANHEGVPSSVSSAAAEDDEIDYFKSVTLFRVNHLTIPMTREAMEAMAWWKRRTLRGQYLLCYDNGKSAVRIRPGTIAIPTSVHGWACNDKKKKTALADPRSLSIDELDADIEPCVLHYVTCGKFWLKTKYQILGNFQDAWFGGTLPIANSFHLDARDVVHRRRDDDDDDAAFDNFYETHLQAPKDPHIIQKHLAAGVLREYTSPARLLVGGRLVAEEVEATTTESEATALESPAPRNMRATTTSVPQDGYEKAWILACAAHKFL